MTNEHKKTPVDKIPIYTLSFSRTFIKEFYDDDDDDDDDDQQGPT